MQELRERLAEIVNKMYEGYNAEYITREIMSLLTLPTVKVKCGECGGTGSGRPCSKKCPNMMASTLGYHCSLHSNCDRLQPCPSCTNGEREYRIVWEKIEMLDMDMDEDYQRPPTYIDLGDPDVAEAYISFKRTWMARFESTRNTPEIQRCIAWRIPNNKGTLRLIEKGVRDGL